MIALQIANQAFTPGNREFVQIENALISRNSNLSVEIGGKSFFRFQNDSEGSVFIITWSKSRILLCLSCDF